MVGRLGEIGYFHRVKTGIDPVAAIPRVMLMIRGLGRGKGPARRKLPISVEDMGAPKGIPELMRIDRQILLTTVLRGWFSRYDWEGSLMPKIHSRRMNDAPY